MLLEVRTSDSTMGQVEGDHTAAGGKTSTAAEGVVDIFASGYETYMLSEYME